MIKGERRSGSARKYIGDDVTLDEKKASRLGVNSLVHLTAVRTIFAARRRLTSWLFSVSESDDEDESEDASLRDRFFLCVLRS